MRFQFENLGLLDHANIELADLTLICGENNSGKTYATYAIYGFLRTWRQMLRVSITGRLNAFLRDNNRFQYDLREAFEGKIDEFLGQFGELYRGVLPRAFATTPEVFANTTVIPSITDEVDLLSGGYEFTVRAGPSGKVLATITKAAGSSIVELLVTESDMRPAAMLNFFADAIADIVFAPHLPRAHISSAERTGAAIFRKELDMARTRMIKAINEIDSAELRRNPHKILQEIDGGYAWPVEDNVDFVRSLEDQHKQKGVLATEHPEILEAFDAIIGGSYKVVKDQLLFETKGSNRRQFTMNTASSSIRALLDVGFWLRSKAAPGDLFIIDEPELNLHPKNQRAFARLVARIVNAGIKVFITTHSDYLVKELNTLIMLNQRTEHTRRVQQHYEYDDSELIDCERVRLYTTSVEKKPKSGSGRRANVRTLRLANIYPDRGIEVETFDKTIELMNSIQEEILYGGEL